jgi:hypothetical protein
MSNEVVLKPSTNTGIPQITQKIPASPPAVPTVPTVPTVPATTKSTKFPNKIPKTARGTPYASLIKEFAFSYLQKEHSSAEQLARIMYYAKRKGLIKTPKDFRKWILNEVCKSINAIDKWIQL